MNFLAVTRGQAGLRGSPPQQGYNGLTHPSGTGRLHLGGLPEWKETEGPVDGHPFPSTQKEHPFNARDQITGPRRILVNLLDFLVTSILCQPHSQSLAFVEWG